MRRLVRVLAAALVLTALWWLFAPDRPGEPLAYLGYVDAETVLVGPKAGGRLETLYVADGDTVARGDPLFGLDCASERAAVEAAEAQLRQAEAQLADLRAPRQRADEIAVLEAQAAQANARAELARTELDRQRRLFERGSTPRAALDQAEAASAEARAAHDAAVRQVAAARLPGREDQVVAAAANVAATGAVLAQAREAFAERSVAAPAAGRVLETFYREGETVPAGQPVVEILPPGSVEVRFYVPEPDLADLAVGRTVAIACDNCPAALSGRVTFIAPEAEFTPPVIFSREERAKLVFLAKAGVPSGTALKPGLPVEVRPR